MILYKSPTTFLNPVKYSTFIFFKFIYNWNILLSIWKNTFNPLKNFIYKF